MVSYGPWFIVTSPCSHFSLSKKKKCIFVSKNFDVHNHIPFLMLEEFVTFSNDKCRNNECHYNLLLTTKSNDNNINEPNRIFFQAKTLLYLYLIAFSSFGIPHIPERFFPRVAPHGFLISIHLGLNIKVKEYSLPSFTN